MRTFFTLLGFLVFSQVHGQICPAQLESVPLSSWSTTQNTSYVDGDLYLDALNEPQYEGIWTIGTGVSNANLSVAENSSISAFIGVKRRNVVAPSDNIEMVDNVYNIEPGYSPLSQGSSSLSELANWNFLLYANLGDYTFEDVDIRLYMDLDPCYTAQVEDMVEIDVAAQFQNFFGNANFSAFGINQNLASNFVQAFDSENIVPFDPTAEGYYTLAVGIYDVCGNLKLWHEVLVNVSSSAANDADGDGIADDQELGGCNNALACNFNCAATENDGSCDFSSCYGCTVLEACNFDELANQEDGSCVACDIATAFCGEGTTWDPVSQTCIVAIPSDSNFDGCVQLNDLLDLLGAYGVCEAEESIWQCGDPMAYQGHDYATVNVGEQCWFAENLRAESYRNGDAIATLVGAQDPFASGDCDLFYSGEGLVGLYGQTWACFTDCSASFEACSDAVETLLTFGLVYNEYAVSDSRGLCPAGWHASTDEEWMILEVAMGMTVEEAQSTGGRGQIAPLLKSDDFWCEDNSGEGNEGLQLRPAGTIQDDCGASSGAGSEGYFWTPSETGQDYFRRLQAGSDDLDRFPGTQTSMLSVRCIQDAE